MQFMLNEFCVMLFEKKNKKEFNLRLLHLGTIILWKWNQINVGIRTESLHLCIWPGDSFRVHVT